MARSYAPLMTTIWSDDDFTALSPTAQRVYLLAFSQPNITYCGVVAFTAKRWARMAAGTSTADIDAGVAELVDHRFVHLDDDTEELWVRSFVRHNGVLGQPQLAKAMVRSFDEILSPVIREMFLLELPESGLPKGCESLTEARTEACSQGAGGLSAGTGQDLNTEPVPESVSLDPDLNSSSSAVTPTGSASSSDDDGGVWVELARLRAEASPVPVIAFGPWSEKVIEDDRAKLAPTLGCFHRRWPNASPEELARSLFDGTQPARAPKLHTCQDCGAGPMTMPEYEAHPDFCEGPSEVGATQEARR